MEIPHPDAPPGNAFKPKLRDLLRTLKLDVTFDRGEGSWLFYHDEAGREIRVLDLVGGYGSLLLGHNHPALVSEAQSLLETGRPFHVQGSVRAYAEKLAAELSRRAGGVYRVVFANSGTEAVEAAMKHAMLESGSRRFLALDRGFHGKTLGALQLAGNAAHRPEPLRIPGIEVARVPANDIAALEAAISDSADCAGFIFEPLMGEGGVRPLDAAFLQRAAELCRARGIPMIADECQTGLGRTGQLFASHALGVEPDYLVLSKALGGGMAKIAALLVREERFQEDFDFLHTSTYADDDFSCALALKTLDLIDDALLATCRERGDQLRAGLEGLAARFPGIIADVRGAGLLLGVQFRPQTFSPSFLLRYTSSLDDLVYLIAGYLFNVHQLRVAPTLSDKFTLRIEPSALLGDEEMAALFAGLEDVCRILEAGDAVALTDFLTHDTAPQTPARFLRSDVHACTLEPRTRLLASPDTAVAHVGWVCHLINADGLNDLEPDFRRVAGGVREQLLERWIPRANPLLMNSVDVQSQTGAKVRLHVVLLPFTSDWVKRSLDTGETAIARELVLRGVETAQTAGASMVALGQYSSIVTANGTRIGDSDCGLTTGNSYAIALAMEALWRAQRTRGVSPGRSTLVIAGAGGNIGRTCAEILARGFARVILVGSPKPGARRRLEQFSRGIPNATVTDDPHAVREGDVVVLALNAVNAPYGPEHFKHDAIVCDLSVPSGVQANLSAERPALLLLRGGIVRLPGGEDLGITGFPLPTGQTYGCMAEALLLGLEGVRDRTYTGSLTPRNVFNVAKMARKHGFTLADYKTECVLGVDQHENLQAS